MKNWQTTFFILGLFLLIILEFFTAFLISPLRLNQDLGGTESLAHFLNMNILYFRIVLIGLVIWGAIGFFRKAKLSRRIIAGFFLFLYVGLFFLANFVAQVDVHFKDQNITICEPVSNNIVPLESVVLGSVINDVAKAYPVDYLAFHHKILDSIGGEPVLVTYCSVCRSGRVFSPVVDGKVESFRLVGMKEFNAIIEDESTLSWWQQATGEAIAGKKKGTQMKEYFSEQMSLESWIRKYPDTYILQPDSTFVDTYAEYEGFGTGYGEVNGRADESWKPTSWVVGVIHKGDAVAFDYDELAENHIMQDTVGNLQVLVALEQDTVSFHAWDTKVDSLNLTFEYITDSGNMMDDQTESIWDMRGVCISGLLEGKKLAEVQSYVEYWHSWERFHPDGRRSNYH